LAFLGSQGSNIQGWFHATAGSKNPKLKNRDLVPELGCQLTRVKASFQHAYGHSGHPENELVDTLASRTAQGKIGLAAVNQ
jgi:ribonuclease HI